MVSDFLGQIHSASAGVVPSIEVDGGQFDQIIDTVLNLPQRAFGFFVETVANFGS